VPAAPTAFEIELTGTPTRYNILATAPDGSRKRSSANLLDQQLSRQLQQIQIELSRVALIGRGDTPAAPHSLNPQLLRSIGEKLFDAIFTGEVSQLYRNCYDRIDDNGKIGINVKLINTIPEFSSTPWELMYDSIIKQFICCSTKTIFMRGIDATDISTTRSTPINILAVSARPKTVGDSPIGEIDVDGEQAILGEVLGDLEKRGLVTLSFADSSTYEAIHDRLQDPPEDDRWDVFHFIGHGGVDDQSQEGYVIFQLEGDTRGAPIFADDLVNLLNIPRRLQLVVLNSCSGAESKSGELFSSTAVKLITAGIPAVIAMQTVISDPAALEFARIFYRNLSNGDTIQKAVTDARIVMKPKFPFECFSPVLYLRSDGQLFVNR
jgi:hypothetical protein